jgi:hypothetical protein
VTTTWPKLKAPTCCRTTWIQSFTSGSGESLCVSESRVFIRFDSQQLSSRRVEMVSTGSEKRTSHRASEPVLSLVPTQNVGHGWGGSSCFPQDRTRLDSVMLPGFPGTVRHRLAFRPPAKTPSPGRQADRLGSKAREREVQSHWKEYVTYS